MVRRLTLLATAGVLLALPAPAFANVSWSPAVELTPRTSAIPEQQVGVDAAGNATALWATSIRAKLVIQVAAKPAGGAWQPPVTVSDPSQDATHPSLAVNRRGDAIAAWSIGPSVRSAFRPAGGTWSAPEDVVTGQPNDRIWDVRAGIDGDGTALVAWQQIDPDRLIRTSSRPVAGGWTPPQTPVTPAPDEPDYQWPTLGVDAEGRATLAWVHRRDAGTVVEAARLSPGGSWSAPQALGAPAGEPLPPAVAVSDSGMAAVMWAERTDAGTILRSAFGSPGGGFSSASTLAGPAPDISDPSAAFTSTGALSAIWARDTGAPGTLIETARWSPVSFSWGPVAAIAGPARAWDPFIAVDAQDNAIALWPEYTATTMQIRSAARTAGAWGPAAFISDPVPDGDLPRLALTDGGSGVAVWERLEGVVISVMSASVSPSSPAPAGPGAPGGGQGATPGGPGAGAGAVRPSIVGGQSILPLSARAPSVSAIKITNKRFRVASGRTALIARTPRGTSFAFSLSAPARVEIAITRSVTGARSRGRCVKLTSKLRRARARRCRRAIVVGTLVRRTVPQGRASIAFTGRLGSRPLGARSYKAIITARNSAGSSKAATLSFTIVR